MHFPKPIDFGALLENIKEQHRRELPFAVYRKPGASKVHAVLQDNRRLVIPRSWGEPGFFMAPYDASALPVIRLQPDRLLLGSSAPPVSPARETCPPEPEEVRNAHIMRVSGALDAIRKGALEKVVLARAVPASLQADPFQVYERLLAYYPRAFCYLWFHPDTGLWMGATPELLLAYSRGEARTVSLAGTLPAQGDQPPDWGPKERHEQQVVTDYICARLREQGLQPETGQTEAFRAGALWHLRTPIAVPVSENQLGQVLEALHPTPAVCGIPLEAARRFIRENEGFNRAYYTGFLGPCGLESPGQADFYVNLRCMQTAGRKASLFVGGGITEGSDPAREWEETRQKCGTVWAAVKNSG